MPQAAVCEVNARHLNLLATVNHSRSSVNVVTLRICNQKPLDDLSIEPAVEGS